MPKLYTNIRDRDLSRLDAVRQTKPVETLAGFVAVAVEREIVRRERGGKVVVAKRTAGRPKGSSD